MTMSATHSSSAQSLLVDRLNRIWEAQMAGRPKRERLLIGWGAIVALVILFVFAIWMPLQEARVRLIRVVATEQKNLATMDAVRRELKSLATATDSVARGAALRTAVEASARMQFGQAVQEVKLDGETTVTVKCTKVRLSKLVPWIESTAQSQRVRLDFASLRADNALVSGELRFVVPE